MVTELNAGSSFSLKRIVTSLGAVFTVPPTAGVALTTRGCANAVAPDRARTAHAAVTKIVRWIVIVGPPLDCEGYPCGTTAAPSVSVAEQARDIVPPKKRQSQRRPGASAPSVAANRR